MLKSEVQHQFWVTKKAVQRKLGSKEDEHIVSSDADLDSKIALLKSISETCTNLNKIIDQYQERLCVLSQEECTFGRFLKEIGKRSKTTGLSITNSGKAIYYCGQQRMSVRVPLLRFQHEVDVFRFRAVGDSLNTLNCMEKERTEYRAALCWMKSLSTRLDPDNDRGLDKFRRAQSHVRVAKENFDKLSMDCIQKIDLLAAARCNMFSHGLVAYMSAIVQFSKKSASTFQTVSSSLILNPLYDFCVLKDLSLNNQSGVNISKIQTADGDQSMLFSNDFQDYNDNEDKKKNEDGKALVDNLLIRLPQKVEEINGSTNRIDDIAILSAWCKEANIQSLFSDAQRLQPQINKENNIASCEAIKKSPSSESHVKKEVKNWFDLFADLDPLENIDSFDLKMNEKLNIQKT